MESQDATKQKFYFQKRFQRKSGTAKGGLILESFFHVGSNISKNVSAKSIGIGAEIVS